uniref:Reverse transcriptase domain-containing protein n=1 Tax=Parascaris equorum TaxID=6256 RepID=A0A914RPJ3_PAREQ
MSNYHPIVSFPGLNYVLFIDDLLTMNGIDSNVLGIDIGEHALFNLLKFEAQFSSRNILAGKTEMKKRLFCSSGVLIFLLLKFPKAAVGSEQETETNCCSQIAANNVRSNGLDKLIEVVKVQEDRVIK